MKDMRILELEKYLLEQFPASHGNIALAVYLRTISERMKSLESRIAQDGIKTDTCTFDILGKKCANCKCWRLPYDARQIENLLKGRLIP